MEIREAIQQALCSESILAYQDFIKGRKTISQMSDEELSAAYRRMLAAGMPGTGAFKAEIGRRKSKNK